MLKCWHFFLLATVVWTVSCLPHPEREPLAGVKGHIHAVGQNLTQFFHSIKGPNNRNLTGSAHTVPTAKNVSKPLDLERGVCYVEVPTVTLVKDPNDVPAGNGSSPTLSKIRKCCTGYERNIHNFRMCDPVCENECINGRCIAPNVCACHPDHVLDLDGYCVATCPIGCLNGHCGPDNECKCNAGYVEEPHMKFCMPVCSKGCSHGNCTAPDVCTCESGYGVNALGACSPKCDGGCTNGDCREPNKCFCHVGYIKNELGVCTPVCSKGCENGQCIAPDTCSCTHGYTLEESALGSRCVAHCSQSCINGHCTGPDQCSCNKGFTPDPTDPTGFRCVGHCPHGCPNGVCSGPNLCLCLPGFVKDRSVKGSQNCVRRHRRSLPHPLKMMLE